VRNRISASEALGLIGNPVFLELREPADYPPGGEYVAHFALPIACLHDRALLTRIVRGIRTAIGQRGAEKPDGADGDIRLASRDLFAVQIPAAMIGSGPAIDSVMGDLRTAVRRLAESMPK